MRPLALVASLACALLAARCRGQDFDLGDALGTDKPTETQRPGSRPGGHDNAGEGFSDSDLFDGTLPPQKPGGRASNPSAGGQGGDSNTGEGAAEGGGMLAGIISSVAVAVVGAVSSFIAYQKKKLCFKQSDQENVNMESQQGAQCEPPVQRTLLEKS